MERAALETITRQLRDQVDGDPQLSLFAVLDCARNEAIRPSLLATDLEYRCLYRGVLPPALTMAAPYVVQLPPRAEFLDELVDRGWGDSWGLFITSRARLDELRRHLRRFLRVKDEEGQTLMFRYYDPRVMRVFLPTCDSEQLESLFGEVESFLVENPEGDGMTAYSLEGTQLRSTVPS